MPVMPVMPAPRKKLAQELANRIVSTRGLVVGHRQDVRRVISNIAFDHDPLETDANKMVLVTLQVAARDEQVFTAIVAARAALGKT